MLILRMSRGAIAATVLVAGIVSLAGCGGDNTSLPTAVSTQSVLSAVSANQSNSSSFVNAAFPAAAGNPPDPAPTPSTSSINLSTGTMASFGIDTPFPVDDILVQVNNQPGYYDVNVSGAGQSARVASHYQVNLTVTGLLNQFVLHVATRRGTIISPPVSISFTRTGTTSGGTSDGVTSAVMVNGSLPTGSAPPPVVPTSPVVASLGTIDFIVGTQSPASDIVFQFPGTTSHFDAVVGAHSTGSESGPQTYEIAADVSLIPAGTYSVQVAAITGSGGDILGQPATMTVVVPSSSR